MPTSEPMKLPLPFRVYFSTVVQRLTLFNQAGSE